MPKRPVWISKDEAEVLLTTLTTAVLTSPNTEGFTKDTLTSALDRLLVIAQGLPDPERQS
jgi:hypothetical protein